MSLLHIPDAPTRCSLAAHAWRRFRCRPSPNRSRWTRASSTCASRARNPSKPARRSRSSSSSRTAVPHCADLEPILQGWIKTMPADVQFRRVPVMYQERWVPLAKIYYTLEALGEEKRLSPEVFATLHSRGIEPVARQDVLRLGGGAGPRPEEGRGHVQLVRDRRARSSGRAQRCAGLSDPIGADGRSSTASSSPTRLPAHQAMPATIDALIAKARAERPKS